MHLYGYRILECKHASSRSEVHFAIRERDKREVVLKRSATSTQRASSRIRREFELLSRMDSPRIVRALDLEQADDSDVLVLERFSGIDLSEFIAKDRPDLATFLEIALQCAEALSEIHGARIIHKDIKPGNILIDPETLAIQVIDFGISSELGETRRDPKAHGAEGTLCYLSPEQTGFLDAGVDSRSDLYSLGATLFELVTDHPPFEAETRDKLVHAHLALRATPASEIVPGFPTAISRIIERLLDKDPEARYQTAQGLRADLAACHQQWTQKGSIDPEFVLGSQDTPHRLRLPRRLYGREGSLERLQEALERAQQGRATFVLLLGPPGIGKSALAESVREPISNVGGRYSRAKFDRYRRDRPYAGFIDLFEGLFEQLLIQPETALESWRLHLNEALGDHAPELAALIPGLAALLETPEAPLRLSAAERQARIASGVRRLVRAIGGPNRPLAFVLDDLHWADAGSLFVLEELIGDRSPQHLLVIGTARANQRDRSEAWREHLTSAAPTSDSLRELNLRPLGPGDTSQYLSDVLGRSQSDIAPLTRRVSLRTGGSPQLIREFLLELQDQGALCSGADGWSWDEAAVDAAAMSDQAVSFASAAIRTLPASGRQLLEAASCIGDVFDPDFLLEVVAADRVHGFRDLMTLSNACLIAPCRDGFRFVHDRLREAAGQKLEPEQKRSIHRAIGEALIRRSQDPDSASTRSMRIADHLNLAGAPISEDERLRLIEVNLQAGKGALESSTAERADGYLRAGLALYRDEDWQAHHDLGFELYFGLIQSAIFGGVSEQAERYLAFLETRGLGLDKWARVAATRIELRTAVHGAPSGVEAGLNALKRLGLQFPLAPSRLRLMIDIWRTRLCLRRRESITRSPGPSTQISAEWKALQQVIAAIGPALFRENLCLHLMTVSYFIRGQVSRRSGVHPLTLASFAHSQAVITGDYAYATQLGQSALAQILERNQPTLEVQVQHICNVLIDPWRRPRRQLLENIQRVTERCFELGVREIGMYSKLWHALVLLTVGEPLSLVERELEEHLPLAKRTAPTAWALRLGILTALAPLTGAPNSCSRSLSGNATRELPTEATVLLASSRHYSNLSGTIRIMTLYLLGQVEEAYFQAKEISRTILWSGGTTLHVSEFELFFALSAGSLAQTTRGRVRKRALRELARLTATLTRRARSAPFNFGHLVALLDAERKITRRIPNKAEKAYQRAAELATENGFRNHLAIIHERWAALLVSVGEQARAAELRTLAIDGYEAWGAHVKVAQLRQSRHRGG